MSLTERFAVTIERKTKLVLVVEKYKKLIWSLLIMMLFIFHKIYFKLYCIKTIFRKGGKYYEK